MSKLKDEGQLNEDRYKVRINGGTGKLMVKKVRKTRKKRLRDKDFGKVKEVGHFQIDTIVELRNGMRRYIIHAVDVFSRFCFSYGYKRGSSLSAKDFIGKLLKVCPYKIKRVQTDNGSEFERYFADELSSKKIEMYKTYPRSPKMNGKVERLNRTMQEEFYERRSEWLFEDIKNFNKKLMEWLLGYNIKRPHWSLKFLSPLRFYVKNILTQKSNMYWTNTL